jgi:hypothetical protein
MSNQTKSKAQLELQDAIHEAHVYMDLCANGLAVFDAHNPALNAVEDAIRLTKFQSKAPAVDSISLDLSVFKAA